MERKTGREALRGMNRPPAVPPLYRLIYPERHLQERLYLRPSCYQARPGSYRPPSVRPSARVFRSSRNGDLEQPFVALLWIRPRFLSHPGEPRGWLKIESYFARFPSAGPELATTESGGRQEPFLW